MTVTIILLSIIIVLLVAIIVMMVTGWPGRERAEIERIGNTIRREMAEHRADSIQLLHSIRIEVEDSVKESIEREMAGYGSRGGRSRSSRGGASRPRSQSPAVVAESDSSPVMIEEDTPEYRASQTDLEARQISLFPLGATAVTTIAPLVEAVPEPTVEIAPVPEPETISMGFIDDIPDVE